MSYLSRRIDEVGRYFLALEAMVGSGALSCVLERCLRELNEQLEAPEKLQEVEEVQSYIDAAVRLGLQPKSYKPLQQRMFFGRTHHTFIPDSTRPSRWRKFLLNIRPIGPQPKHSERAFFASARRETRQSPRPAKHPYDPCETLISQEAVRLAPVRPTVATHTTRHNVTRHDMR